MTADQYVWFLLAFLLGLRVIYLGRRARPLPVPQATLDLLPAGDSAEGLPNADKVRLAWRDYMAADGSPDYSPMEAQARLEAELDHYVLGHPSPELELRDIERQKRAAHAVPPHHVGGRTAGGRTNESWESYSEAAAERLGVARWETDPAWREEHPASFVTEPVDALRRALGRRGMRVDVRRDERVSFQVEQVAGSVFEQWGLTVRWRDVVAAAVPPRTGAELSRAADELARALTDAFNNQRRTASRAYEPLPLEDGGW